MQEQKDEKAIEKQQQFMVLYTPVHARFSRFCRAIAGGYENARDLHADSILIAYEKLDKLRQPERFLYFLFSIASRQQGKKQRRARFTGIFSQAKAEAIKDHSANPEESAEVSLLLDAMQKLPQLQREALALFEISGCSLKDIQMIQGGSLSGVKLRISRGRQKLAMMMGVKNIAGEPGDTNTLSAYIKSVSTYMLIF